MKNAFFLFLLLLVPTSILATPHVIARPTPDHLVSQLEDTTHPTSIEQKAELLLTHLQELTPQERAKLTNLRSRIAALDAKHGNRIPALRASNQLLSPRPSRWKKVKRVLKWTGAVAGAALLIWAAQSSLNRAAPAEQRSKSYHKLTAALYDHHGMSSFVDLPPELSELFAHRTMHQDHALFYPFPLTTWQPLGKNDTNIAQVIDYLPDSRITVVRRAPTLLQFYNLDAEFVRKYPEILKAREKTYRYDARKPTIIQFYKDTKLVYEIDAVSDCSIIAACRSPLEPLLFFSTSQGTLITYDLQTNTIINSFIAHETGAKKIACHPTEPIIVTGDYSGNLSWWQYDGTFIQTVPKTQRRSSHRKNITALAFNNDGSLLASASDDGRIRVWDHIGQPVTSFQVRSASSTVAKDSIYDLVWNDDHIAIVGSSTKDIYGFLRIYTIHGDLISDWTVGPKGPRTIALKHYELADGTHKTIYATGSPNGKVHIWSKNGLCLARIAIPDRTINSVDLSAALDTIILSSNHKWSAKEEKCDYEGMARSYPLPTRYLQGKLLLPQVLFIKSLYAACPVGRRSSYKDLARRIAPEAGVAGIKEMFESFEPMIQEHLKEKFDIVES